MTKRKPTFRTGQKIRLRANKREGWKQERATYGGKSGHDTHVVFVTELANEYDDGMREVTTGQILKGWK